MSKRAYALDALRGYAIITMVLSGTIVTSILPAWMSHAQVPPPNHVFNPELPGITWVDLVFPFFLFAMGAAFPFSINKRLEGGDSKLKLIYEAIKRGLELTFFAIFIQHFYPYTLSSPQDVRSWLLAISCFIVLFPMFMRMPFNLPKLVRPLIKLGAYAVAITMLLTVDYANNMKFSLYNSNIIILLLANMAIFGTIIYTLTMKNRTVRLAILLLVMGVFFSATVAGSWTETFFKYTPIPWLYSFEYLRYLFIVIPGTIAGEYFYDWMKSQQHEEQLSDGAINKRKALLLSSLTVVLVVLNLYCLFTRLLFVNFILTSILLIAGWFFLFNKEEKGLELLWKKLYAAGAFLLILGLCFDPFQGGIKKDPATYSYYFVTSGLAFMAMIFFSVVCDYLKCHRSTKFLIMCGQNPMIAYVSTSLLIMPILHLLGLADFLSIFATSPILGFVQGILLTGLAVLVTMFFTKIGWFWRT